MCPVTGITLTNFGSTTSLKSSNDSLKKEPTEVKSKTAHKTNAYTNDFTWSDKRSMNMQA